MLGEDICANDHEGIIAEETERVGLEREEEGIKKLIDPILPSKEEVERHYLMGHIPFRNWCPVCVKAKGRELDHSQVGDKERTMSEYSFDYCFPGDEFGFKWTVLVGKERKSKMWMATAVPMKGSSGRFSVDQCIDFIQEIGDSSTNIIVKSDQEPAIEYLIKDLIENRPEGKTISEVAPVKSKGSNGVIERAVQEIEGEIRAIFIGFQERLGIKLSAKSRIISFIPEYAAYLLNRLHKGQDGKVGYERIKGKKPTVLGLEFGEKVLFKKNKGLKMEKINEKFEYGIFVGVRRRSNEVLVCSPEGLHAVRTVSRILFEKRWGMDNVNWIEWVPWHRYKDAGDADGDIPEDAPVEEAEPIQRSGDAPVFVETKEKVPR